MLLLWSTILYKTTFVLKDGYKFYLSMFVTASFAHSIAVKLEWGLFLCVRAYFCAFLSPSLYNGASWWSYPQWRIRTDQWPRTPSPLAPSQSVQKQIADSRQKRRVNQQEITRLNSECGMGAVLQHKQTHQCTCKRSLSWLELHSAPTLLIIMVTLF